MHALANLVCPISQALPVDPVHAPDGNIYERECIEKHLSTQKISPITREPMTLDLRPARYVTNIIQDMHDASKQDIQKKDTRLDEWEAATAHANRTETVDGTIKVFAKGKHVRTEFAPGHAMQGRIKFFNDRKHVRSEFAPGHARHGEIHFYKDEAHVRTEFAPGHANHGEIHFKGGKRVRTKIAQYIMEQLMESDDE